MPTQIIYLNEPDFVVSICATKGFKHAVLIQHLDCDSTKDFLKHLEVEVEEIKEAHYLMIPLDDHHEAAKKAELARLFLESDDPYFIGDVFVVAEGILIYKHGG